MSALSKWWFSLKNSCRRILSRKYRFVLMIPIILYVFLIQFILPVMGLALYMFIFILILLFFQIAHMNSCDFKTKKKVLIDLFPSVFAMVMLAIIATFFSGGALQLLGMDSAIATQAEIDLTDAAANVWTLSNTYFVNGSTASVSWMTYGPVCIGAGVFIMGFGDAKQDDNVKAFGALLMMVPLVVDLITNLSGVPTGLISDILPILSFLPQGGLTGFILMLLNLLPDVILFSLMAGVVEKAIAEPITPFG